MTLARSCLGAADRLLSPALSALLTWFILWSAATSADVRAEVITLRADKGCPYVCDPAADHPGYAVEVAREVFTALGYTLDVQLTAWEQALSEAKQGRIDGVIGSSAVPGRGLIYPVESIGIAFNVLAVRKGERFAYRDASSLAGHRLGAIAGYSYDPEIVLYLKAHVGDPAAVQVTSNSDDALDINLRALVGGQLDVMIDDANVIIAKLDPLGIRDRIEFAHRFDDDPLFIGFSAARPTSALYARALSDGIVRLRGTGGLERILARYGVPDWR
ncbi:putative ABC transporter, periplasmic substrate-binding protein [uncultured Gammaproteobacteria bacterium]